METLRARSTSRQLSAAYIGARAEAPGDPGAGLVRCRSAHPSPVSDGERPILAGNAAREGRRQADHLDTLSVRTQPRSEPQGLAPSASPVPARSPLSAGGAN